MSEREGQIKKDIEESHKATESSRINKKGLTDQKEKLSSKNFDKLMSQRGLSSEARANLKKSNAQGMHMEVRHAKAGEQFVTTHGMEQSSGVFVSEKLLGKSPGERINKGALPHSNTAEYETKVELAKNQNLVYGKIAPQSKFSKMDPKQQPRSGGGEQVITDGGYNAGAIRTKDSKYPVPAKQAFMQRAAEHKKQNGAQYNNAVNTNQRASSKSHAKTGGQKKQNEGDRR